MHIPSLPHGLFLFVHNQMFNSLIDTGASHSFIDTEIVNSLSIPISPSNVIIDLASTSHSLPSPGIAVITFTPVIIQGTLNMLPPMTHSFELMDLPRHKHQFIVGRDLLRAFFLKQLPMSLLPPDADSAPSAAASNIRISTPTSSLIHTPIPRMPLSPAVANELKRDIDALEGQGYIPSDEEPVRVMTSTPAELEESFSIQRNCILQLPVIATSLQHNEAIDSFCNLPEAMLKLKLDPTKSSSSQLYARQYPLSQRAIEAAQPVIQRWLSTGKIVRAPPGCPYNNPLTVAPKKDDNGKLTGFRVCLDTRKLNAALVDNDHFEIPLIRSVLNSLQGCTIFGEFDLAEAYLQFPLHLESQQYTAFTFGNEQYMFTACPFGLSVMPSHFQRIMQFVFRDLPFTFPYFDNIPFGSRSWKEHAAHTQAIIERLNHYNLRIKPSSVKIGQAQLNCLGHLLTEAGVAISPDKLSKIQDWPLPKTGKQLASFLGLITFVRQHVRHFADMTSGLEALKRTKGDVTWTPELIKSFELVRHAIAHAPLLRFPDFNKPFYVATDASCLGIGGVLYQPDSPSEDITGDNIIAICSKKLNDTQRRYSTYKKELYAVIYCLRQFHAYIWGHHQLVIVTDHMPLTYILTSATLAHSLQQWLDVILDYNFAIKHRPGVLHVLPDALSRMYEALYTSAWGVPVGDPLDIVKQHHLSIDKDVLISMSQPPPLMDPKRPVRTRTVSASSVSASRGGEMDIHIEIDNDADDVDMHQINYDNNGIPVSPSLFVQHNPSSQLQSGLGLYAAIPFQHGQIICDTTTDPIFNPYINSSAQGNARRFIDPDSRTAHIIALRPISAGDEIITVHRTVTVRTVSAADIAVPDVEQKYNDVDDEIAAATPASALSLEDKELKLIVELERRGKIAPSTREERLKLIDEEHQRGHFGRDAIYRKLFAANHWWPGMRNTIQERIRECIPCLRFNIAKRGFDPATPITAAFPFDHIQIDHKVGLPKSKDGFTAILVIVDVCTGFILLRAVLNTQAETIAAVLWQIFNDFGFPKVIQSDNGPEFVNRIISKMIMLSGVDHRRITPYHARADGKVERNIGTMMTIIRKHLHGAHESWPAFVPWAQSCVNNKISELTGSTPFSLMFGRKFNPYQDYTSSAPLDVMNESEWTAHQDRMISIVYPSIAERVSIQKDKMVSRLNKRNPARFRKGDIVMLRRSEAETGSPVGKLEAQYTGPYQIASMNRTGAITIVTSTGAPLPRNVRPHMLKFVSHSSKDFMEEQYEVDRILGHQGEGDNRKYLIRWKGYGPEADSWEPVEGISADETIRSYLATIDPSSPSPPVHEDEREQPTPPSPAPKPRAKSRRCRRRRS